MSDEGKPVHPFSDEELRAALTYIGDKSADTGCPFCGNITWTFETQDENLTPRLSFVMLDNRAFFGSAPAIPAITLTCDNCGFIRQHNVPMIMSKIKNGG